MGPKKKILGPERILGPKKTLDLNKMFGQYIYMVRSKARQHFQVSNVKKIFFAEAGMIKVCSCVSKQKMFLSDQGTNG